MRVLVRVWDGDVIELDVQILGGKGIYSSQCRGAHARPAMQNHKQNQSLDTLHHTSGDRFLTGSKDNHIPFWLIIGKFPIPGKD